MCAERIRHGAYLCVSPARDAVAALAATPVEDLAAQLGLQNESLARDGHPPHAVAFLRHVESSAGHLSDERLLAAAAVVHAASNDGGMVSRFCAEMARLLHPVARVRTLRGTAQPRRYTGGAMHEFAYAHQRVQQSADAMPNAFLLPLRKSPEWWAKNWMERHTYFLPRYDADGRMISEGHALAAAPGIPVLMRRTYRCGDVSFRLKAEATDYDFLTYFECADADVATFHAVCAALRDERRNPEWRFVREGPTWRGRRMPSWSSLWTSSDTAPTTPAR
jgi:hypothetical protein